MPEKLSNYPNQVADGFGVWCFDRKVNCISKLLPNSEHHKRSAAFSIMIAAGPNSKLIKLTKGIHWTAASFLSAHTALHIWVGGEAGQI